MKENPCSYILTTCDVSRIATVLSGMGSYIRWYEYIMRVVRAWQILSTLITRILAYRWSYRTKKKMHWIVWWKSHEEFMALFFIVWGSPLLRLVWHVVLWTPPKAMILVKSNHLQWLYQYNPICIKCSFLAQKVCYVHFLSMFFYYCLPICWSSSSILSIYQWIWIWCRDQYYNNNKKWEWNLDKLTSFLHISWIILPWMIYWNIAFNTPKKKKYRFQIQHLTRKNADQGYEFYKLHEHAIEQKCQMI